MLKLKFYDELQVYIFYFFTKKLKKYKTQKIKKHKKNTNKINKTARRRVWRERKKYVCVIIYDSNTMIVSY